MTMCSPPVSNSESGCPDLASAGQNETHRNVMNVPVTVHRDDDSRRERLVRWKAEQSECADSVDSSFAVLVSPGNGGLHQVDDEEVGSNGSSYRVDSSRNERKLVDDALAEYTRQLQARMTHATSDGSKEGRKSAADIREELRQTERKIFKAARIELEMLNRSKKIRAKREVMTKRYKRLCQLLDVRVKEESGDDNRDAPFVPARLPPVMPPQVYDLTQIDDR